MHSPSISSALSLAAAKTPGAPALIGNDASITWTEFEEQSRRLAQWLLANGVSAGERVAVSRRKGIESYVAVNAVVRAGAVMVPIDPLAPATSARSVLTEADVVAVITDDHTIGALDPTSLDSPPRLVVSDSTADGVIAFADTLLAIDDAPDLPVPGDDDPIYIIFTSGSTGRPKGIVHTHASAQGYVDAAVEAHRLTSDDVIAGMTAFHFDISTLELYAAPAVGSTVVIMDELVMRFPASFAARADEHAVSVIYTVPFFLRSLTERGGLAERDLTAVRAVIYGGEPYPPRAMNELMALLPDETVYTNIYGPAETNGCTVYDFTDVAPDAEEIPIGAAWSAATLRVVDEHGADVPDGEPGELLITGTTVMAEYWRRPDLTEAGIHVDADGRRWYRSGDIVVRDADGVCHFRGRRDHQVKVRGVRLELEAVESVLTDAPGVLHAVAGPVGAAGEIDHLGSLVILEEGAELDAREVRRWCAARLHPAAVPQWYETVRSFPETGSGKIARKVIREAISLRSEQRSAAEHLEELTRDR